jgi:Uma2 family endonuclease
VATTAPRRTPPLSIEEFLEMEGASPTKHEYVAGQIFARAGASERHTRLAGNISAHLWNAARSGPCRVYGSDMRLRIGDSAIYYPDVQVVCDPADTHQSYMTQPCVVVEVLSPSTQSIDLREKLVAYRSLESVQVYLIVWRDQMRVLTHYRAEEQQWFDDIQGREGRVSFPCPGLKLAVADIYEGVELPTS